MITDPESTPGAHPMNPTEAAAILRAAGWRCEPPDDDGAPTLVPESEAAVAPPQAPRVGEVWEAPSHVARTVAYLDGGHVLYRLRGYAGRVHAAKQSRWHAWVRRSGAKVVA